MAPRVIQAIQSAIQKMLSRITMAGDTTEAASTVPLAVANNHLGFNLYNVLSKEQGNIFFSPFSISSALAMLYCGAKDETAKEMRKVLGYETARIKDENIQSSFQEFLQEVEKSPDSCTLTSANSLLCQEGFSVKEEYKSVLTGFFKALFQEIDIEQENEKAIQAINKWVCEKTCNMIPKFLDALDPETVLVILNAVYFKGFWKYPFDKTRTYLQNFFIRGQENNAKSVPMMRIKNFFPHSRKETFEAIELPYLGEDISMLILLPYAKDGLQDLEEMFNCDFIRKLQLDLMKTNIEVRLPKFKLEFSKPLKEPFKSLGLEKVFTKKAELGGISDAKKLLVSKIFHKAVIEVNEEGSEASAATRMKSIPFCAPKTFIADHPFVFVIYNKKNDMVLFIGRVEELY